MLTLEKRFISFFHSTFGGSSRHHMAFSNFFWHIIKKYKIDYDADYFENKLYYLLEFYHNKKQYKLNLADIELIADLLNKFVNSVQSTDLIQDYSSKHCCYI